MWHRVGERVCASRIDQTDELHEVKSLDAPLKISLPWFRIDCGQRWACGQIGLRIAKTLEADLPVRSNDIPSQF